VTGLAAVGARLSNPQRQPGGEALRGEVDQAMVAVRHRFALRTVAHGVKVRQPVWHTLLDALAALSEPLWRRASPPRPVEPMVSQAADDRRLGLSRTR